MSSYTVAIFILALFIACFYAWFLIVYLPPIRRVTQKYPLFAVRDTFVRLKLEGKFEHDPRLYEFLCHITNHLIVHTAELNLRLFLDALATMEPDLTQYNDIKRRLVDAPQEVQNAEQQLWGSVEYILIQNSTLVRTLVIVRAFRLFRNAITNPNVPVPTVAQPSTVATETPQGKSAFSNLCLVIAPSTLTEVRALKQYDRIVELKEPCLRAA